MLEESAGYFFADLQYILREYLFIQVYKITDSASTKVRKNEERDNLTVKFFVKHGQFGEDTKEVQRLSAEIHSFREKITEARNRRAAHSDRVAAVENHILGKFRYGDFEIFLDNLQNFLNILHSHYIGGPYDLGKFNEAADVVEVLKQAHHYRDIREDNEFAEKCFLIEENSPFKEA